MKYGKIFLERFLKGIPIGVFIGQVFYTLSICIFKFSYTVTWEVVLIQNIAAGIIGGYCYAGSTIYKIEKLSRLQQTAIQWISLLPFIPVAWYMHWMPRNTWGIIGFIFFYIVWILGFWFFYTRKYTVYAEELNEELKNIKLRKKS
ncbi:DUF3021 domain-containing protein [uncultured Clostridium sp.]|uniref:DUF3021 domain-containing protein n=1 Tax=uncultured Clostridium sp. TaxID=59620 RepID=UPI002610A683|nr:DUF3021 domain-containing protein [uncultured Clostridium sp.]